MKNLHLLRISSLLVFSLLFLTQEVEAQNQNRSEILIDHYKRQRAIGQAKASVANLNNMWTALEMYKTDHKRYPARLKAISPRYLRAIPKEALPQSLSLIHI